jgi:subtilisin family serine protease
MRGSVLSRVLLLVGLLAPAGVRADVVLQARVWTGSQWGTFLGTDGNLVPHIQVGIFAQYTDAVGIVDARFNIRGQESRSLGTGDRTLELTGSGLGPQAPFHITGSAAAFFTPMSWRIDALGDGGNDPSLGLQLSQNPPFNPTANPSLLYTFTYSPSIGLTALTVTITPGEAGVFVLPAAGGVPVPASVTGYETATIAFAPSPAPLAALALAGFAGARRRRR